MQDTACPATFNSNLPSPSQSQSDGEIVDPREQLFNQQITGQIQHVQLPEKRIVDLHGIMLDLDPRLLKPSSLTPVLPEEPTEFYRLVARPWLDRHDVLRRAEVRNSGRGLHIILRPDSPIALNSDGDKQRWKGIIQLIQCSLPSYPNAPSLTALTRPLGSINSKVSLPVAQLAPGEPISISELEGFAEE